MPLQGTFRKCGLVEGSEVTGGIPLKGKNEKNYKFCIHNHEDIGLYVFQNYLCQVSISE
jgi:hypothetical protein